MTWTWGEGSDLGALLLALLAPEHRAGLSAKGQETPMAPWGLLLLPREDAVPGDPAKQGRMGPPTLGGVSRGPSSM